MPVEVRMPQMGESITEGTLVKWFKKKGEKVNRDEILFEISTDKVDTEIPSPAEGYLSEILVGEGETVPVDTPVCLLDAGEAAAEARPRAAEAAPGGDTGGTGAGAAPSVSTTGEAAAATTTADSRQRLSPAVRRLVREHGVDVSRIRGTGSGGRVTRNDVLAYLEAEGRPAASPATAAAPPPAGPEAPALTDRSEPFSVMRRQIAEHMVASRRTSPHVSTVHEADMSAVALLRRSLIEKWKDRGVKPTYMPFVVQAVAGALRRFPVINASVAENEIHYKGDINIGIAIALDDGLIVPVIRHADMLTIVDLARAIDDLATRARAKGLKPEEVQTGTFSITNPGVFGSLIGTPIIHQPQVAILCLGAVKKRPVVLPDTDAIAVRSMCYLTLTFDHRIIDGAVADRFLGAVIGYLEAGEFRIEP